MALLLVLALLLQGSEPVSLAQEPEVDPALKEVVERFFAAQEAEDVEAYLSLWSTTVKPPTREQLRFIFESGADDFQDLRITRAVFSGDTARLRVRVLRVRTDERVKQPDGSPRVFRTPLEFALAFVRDGDGWKLVREGLPVDELALALIEARDPAQREALMAAERDLVNVRLYEAISRRADALSQQQQYAAAQVIYERSLEAAVAAGHRGSEGQALQNIANALYFQRKFEDALAMYRRRLALEREAADEDGIADALVGIATIQYSTYDYTAALATYTEALEIQERLDDHLLIANTLISTGSIRYLRGEYERATADYRRAEALKRKYRDLAGAASALEGLGRVFAAQGDLPSALDAFTAAHADRVKLPDPARLGTVLYSIGDVHFRLGNLDHSRLAFAEARRAFDTAKDLSAAGRALQGTALVELVAGRTALGERAYIESIEVCTAGDDEACVAVAQAGLGYALSAQRKFDAAVSWYRKAVDAFTALAYEEQAARARIGLAEALTGREDFEAAHAEAVTARRAALGLNNDDVLWRALVSQSRAERKMERHAEALGSAKAAVVAVQTLMREALDRPTVSVSRDTAAAFAAVAVLQAEGDDATGALESAEAMRAHVLRLWLAPHEREIARGMTDEERAEERTLTVELMALLARQEREAKLQKPDAASLARLDGAIAEAIAARTAARERLFARLPALATARGLSSSRPLEHLGILFDAPSDLVMSFVVDEHDVVVLLARRPEAGGAIDVSAHVVALGRQILAESIARAMEPSALRDLAAWRAKSADLFAFLPEPVRTALAGADAITVIPHDLLWRVPFEAMPLGESFLADIAEVTYAASLAAAVYPGEGRPEDLERPMHAAAGLPALVVAAPQLPDAAIERLKATAPSWHLRAPDAGRAEADVVAAVYTDPDAHVITGGEATPDAVKRGMASARAIHLSAPFRVNSAAPLFSPVLLAGAETEADDAAPDDSRIEMREIFTADVAADTLVVSDPAALSMRDAGAAVVPVDWAWRTAGISTFVVRRWADEAGEQASTALMRRFHETLRGGARPAEAMRRAAAAARTAGATRAPAFWAGWLLLGGR